MENSIQQGVTCKVSEKATKPTRGFRSAEAMEAYYLQLAEITGTKCHDEQTDDISIRRLYRKLKQFNNMLAEFNIHEWGKGIAEIQNACGYYMMQSDIDRKKLLQTNEEIGLHLQFLINLAGSTPLLRQIQGIIAYHLQNVEYLLKGICKKDNETLARSE